MSQLGQKRQFELEPVISGLPPISDMPPRKLVAKGQTLAHALQQTISFNHLIGEGEQ